MLTIAMLCAIYVWDAPAGEVDHYEAFLDGQPWATLLPITDPTVEVCVLDGDPHILTVVAFDIYGNQSEVSGSTLPRVIQADLPRASFDDSCRADFFRDGRVGLDDYGMFVQLFNSTCDW